MSTSIQAQIEPSFTSHAEANTAPHWSFLARVGFRFCLAYFGLFCLSNQILGGLLSIPIVDFPDLASLWPTRSLVFWVAECVFRVKTALVYTGSGSGDKTFDWILAFCLIIIAASATGIWSLLDRRRENYVTLEMWFRLFLRFALASQMLLYGMDKVIPLQMPSPILIKLVEPFGNFSPMGVLWSSVGASRSYEIFAGSAETLAGILLIVPRTATLGALICLADMIQVFTLNMTYDVPVKLFSFHLLLMAVFLLVPEIPRLVRFFFLNSPVEPLKELLLFRTARANRLALILQLAFGIWLLGTNLYGGWRAWYKYGGGAPKSALYGIWNVDQLLIDGQFHSPLLTDYDYWRRVIFDSYSIMGFERMDESLTRYSSSIDEKNKTISVTKNGNKNWKANFSYNRPDLTNLTLDGTMDSHKLHMQLHLVDRNSFLLVNRGFHWIQEYPFNR